LKAAVIILAVIALVIGGVIIGTMQMRTAAPAEAAFIIIGDAARGEDIFHNSSGGAPACSQCHITEGFPFGMAVAPSLDGVGERAAERIEGVDAETYLHQSIVAPAEFVTPGFRSIMFSEYAAHLSEQDIADLIAYLLTL
jgi:cytochrome c553